MSQVRRACSPTCVVAGLGNNEGQIGLLIKYSAPLGRGLS